MSNIAKINHLKETQNTDTGKIQLVKYFQADHREQQDIFKGLLP